MSSPKDKPEAEKLGWQIVKSEIVHQGKTSQLRSDEVLPKGESEPIVYEYDQRAQAVIIVPVTADGAVVLIRQYRYPVDSWCLETPAGGCHDTGDLPLEEVVRKELQEEIGATAAEVEYIGRFFTAPSYADEVAHIFIAWDTELVKKAESEATEEILLEVMSAAGALASARGGEMVTAPCALALLRCEERLRSRGFL